MIAAYPGSFDPATLGHIDIINRSIRFCDQLYVLVGNNYKKEHSIPIKDRVSLLTEAISANKNCVIGKNIIIDTIDGMLYDYLRIHNINFIIRGIRSFSDISYEMHIGAVNSSLHSDLETIFLPAEKRMQDISSSLVREMVRLGYTKDASKFVPKNVSDYLINNNISVK